MNKKQAEVELAKLTDEVKELRHLKGIYKKAADDITKKNEVSNGKIRELNEKFSNGMMYPSDPSGGAAEVINCRCTLSQRAKWALDEDELQALKDRASYFGLDKTANFEEFKVKYLKSIEDSVKDSTIIFGGVTGAINPANKEAEEHAKKYYGLVRSMTTDVAKISAATGFSKEDIQAIKNFLFYEQHDLGGDKPQLFEPDFMIALSWQRLIDGKPEPHDLTLLRHEIMEKELMTSGMTQKEAHIKTTAKYNYAKEAREYHARIKKHKNK